MRDAVARVMQHVADQKKALSAEAEADRARVRRRQQRGWLLVCLAVVGLAMSITVSLPRWRQPFQPPTGAAAERDARRAVVLAVSLVERYHTETGSLPSTLAQTGATLPGVAYRITRQGYEVSVTIEGRAIVFQSGDDPASLAPAPPLRSEAR